MGEPSLQEIVPPLPSDRPGVVQRGPRRRAELQALAAAPIDAAQGWKKPQGVDGLDLGAAIQNLAGQRSIDARRNLCTEIPRAVSQMT